MDLLMMQICLSFYEVKNKQATWFTNKVERLHWEQWYINLNVAQHPKPHSGKSHHSKVVVGPGGKTLLVILHCHLYFWLHFFITQICMYTPIPFLLNNHRKCIWREKRSPGSTRSIITGGFVSDNKIREREKGSRALHTTKYWWCLISLRDHYFKVSSVSFLCDFSLIPLFYYDFAICSIIKFVFYSEASIVYLFRYLAVFQLLSDLALASVAPSADLYFETSLDCIHIGSVWFLLCIVIGVLNSRFSKEFCKEIQDS